MIASSLLPQLQGGTGVLIILRIKLALQYRQPYTTLLIFVILTYQVISLKSVGKNYLPALHLCVPFQFQLHAACICLMTEATVLSRELEVV
jgi:hypothetical protein